MIKRCTLLLLTASLFAAAAPIQWTLASGGNGHYYEYVPASGGIFSGISFDAAKAAAESSTYLGLTGYLATITSAAENSFLLNAGFSLIYGFGGNPFSSVWIGASDQQTDGTFRWLAGPEAGQTLNYSNFFPNVSNPAGVNYPVFGRFALENPLNGSWLIYDSTNRALGYIIEYGPAASTGGDIPEPSTWTLAATSCFAFLLIRSRRSNRRRA